MNNPSGIDSKQAAYRVDPGSGTGTIELFGLPALVAALPLGGLHQYLHLVLQMQMPFQS